MELVDDPLEVLDRGQLLLAWELSGHVYVETPIGRLMVYRVNSTMGPLRLSLRRTPTLGSSTGVRVVRFTAAR